MNYIVGSYGVSEQTKSQDDLDTHVEELKLSGYTALWSGLTELDLANIADSFDTAAAYYKNFCSTSGVDLEALNEADVIRVMPRWSQEFFKIVFNERLHRLLSRTLGDYFVVNQVNGLINRAHAVSYSQAKWHRDLPWRHMTTSRPIAINALFALDDFTIENGATWVIPGSHTIEPFPSEDAVRALGRQVPCKAGTFIILDAMTFHAGGVNLTGGNRRAINHVFTIPSLRQQLHLPSILGDLDYLSSHQLRLLGYGLNEYRSFEEYFKARYVATSTR